MSNHDIERINLLMREKRRRRRLTPERNESGEVSDTWRNEREQERTMGLFN